MSTYNATRLPAFALLKPEVAELFPRFTLKEHYQLLYYTLSRDSKTGKGIIQDDKGWKTEVTTDQFTFLFCTQIDNELWIPVLAGTKECPVRPGTVIVYRMNSESYITGVPERLNWTGTAPHFPITHYYQLLNANNSLL